MVPLRYGIRTIQRILCPNAISHSQCTTKDMHARARMLNYCNGGSWFYREPVRTLVLFWYWRMTQ
jgi:hypothetical protein